MAKLPPPPVLRGSSYYLYRRVPARYRKVDARLHVDQSLHTDSFSDATAKAMEVWNQLLAAWEAKLAGDSGHAETRFAAAQDLAQRRGFRYLPASTIATLPYDDLMKRLHKGFGDKPGKVDILEAEAILGGAAEPPITISRALELYWSLAKDKTLTKSWDQLRRWQNPRKKAIRNLIDVIGDKGVALRILAMGIDTSTPTGKLMLTILGGVAEFEREIMLERQREGIQKAKIAGKYKGRAPTAQRKKAEVEALVAEGIGPTEIAKRLGISRASVYNVMGQRAA